MKLWQRFENRLEAMRQAIPGGPEGWRPERLIFRDWWHWKEQEFGFAHGRLALTGQNAGGKSSTLALTIPMLLDGRTEPSRLDPAQSRDRFLHYYLLGPDEAEAGNPEAFRYEARTGYVALEFYHRSEQRYVTIGIGVTASRNHPRRITDWWGFLVLKNRRLGRDFDVRGADEACLGRREFTRTLGEDGVVVTERGEYQRLVNKELFGMEEDDYQALIEMLLQARRPKLGEQSGPDKVCDMLSQALPGIPADRLERVGDVVNNIEEYRRNLLDVQEKAAAVARIDQALLDLAEALVKESAERYQEAQGHYGSVISKLRQARESFAQAEQELANLAERAQGRAVERTTAMAAREELKTDDASSLQERLSKARQEQSKVANQIRGLLERVKQAEENLSSNQVDVEEVGTQFTTRKRAILTAAQELYRRIEALTWAEGAQTLAEATRYTEVLAVEDPAEVVLDAGPGGGLGDQARNLASEFRSAAKVGAERDEAQRHREQAQAQVEALRADVKAISELVEAAKDQAEAAGELLVEQLYTWAEANATLEPPSEMLSEVVTAMRERLEPVSGGYRDFTEPLFLWGERRRHELARLQDELSRQLTTAQLRLAQLAEEHATIATDAGDPIRSEVRASARAQLGDGPLPLYRCIRFRAGVAPEVAARVETAMLEAGWLDLLAEPVAGADAYLVPEPRKGPTLCEVLEPLPEAPIVVAQWLSSIGWGQENGDRWVAADGAWRNGPGQGSVAPWSPVEAGYLGAEARERRKQHRLQRLAAAMSDAQATHDKLSADRALIEEQKRQIELELRSLERLPWQAWFTELTLIKTRQLAWEETRTRLEAAKPSLYEAERALLEAERRFDEVVDGLPGARGLSPSELGQQGDRFVEIAARLDSLLPLYRELGGLTQRYRQLQRGLDQARLGLANLRSDLEAAQTEKARTDTAVATLEGQIQDPLLQNRLAKLGEIEARLRELAQAEDEDQKLKVHLSEQRGRSLSGIDELEPQERARGEERARRLEQIKEQLCLHVALADHIEALDKAGPVSYIPKLQRLVETENLADEIIRRRRALLEQEHRERSRLAEYRPTQQGQNSLIFYEERIPLAAHELHERLEWRAREYAELMAEEQRKLFQDIIYEGILDELRRLVRQAREFTRRTNEKLKRPLSNGELLSLRWSSIPPEQVPAARIGAALDQMEQGSRFLSEEKREVLLSTIREEVERVRSVALAQGRELSYHEAVAEALDYRRWYQFQILSKMPGNANPVPIRTKGFGKRSTSAKAWALAVPILAAVAARYDSSPRTDLPRLVGLDEAFAGFDTKNQENYVGLLTDLAFSWIITIPDEVPYNHTLSAVMTYRMSLEENFHTGFPILWNGNVAYDPMSAWNAGPQEEEQP